MKLNSTRQLRLSATYISICKRGRSLCAWFEKCLILMKCRYTNMTECSHAMTQSQPIFTYAQLIQDNHVRHFNNICDVNVSILSNPLCTIRERVKIHQNNWTVQWLIPILDDCVCDLGCGQPLIRCRTRNTNDSQMPNLNGFSNTMNWLKPNAPTCIQLCFGWY